jgi:hypothetical protein
VVRLTESGCLVNRLAANGPHTSAGATFAGAAANETPAAALILCVSGGAATVGALDARIGPVAQWSELAAHNRLVAGSSPAGPTNKNNELFDIFPERANESWISGNYPGNNLQISRWRARGRPGGPVRPFRGPWRRAAFALLVSNLPPAPEPQFAESRRPTIGVMCQEPTFASNRKKPKSRYRVRSFARTASVLGGLT